MPNPVDRGIVVTSPDPTVAVKEGLADVVRLFDREIVHVEKIAELRERHQEKLAAAESARIDSIRHIDREEAKETARVLRDAQAQQARATQEMAETLRSGKAASDVAFNKRMSALELASSASAGKSAVADPQMERLAALVEKLATAQTSGTGRSAGSQQMWGYVMAVVGLVAALLAIWSKLGGGP